MLAADPGHVIGSDPDDPAHVFTGGNPLYDEDSEIRHVRLSDGHVANGPRVPGDIRSLKGWRGRLYAATTRGVFVIPRWGEPASLERAGEYEKLQLVRKRAVLLAGGPGGIDALDLTTGTWSPLDRAHACELAGGLAETVGFSSVAMNGAFPLRAAPAWRNVAHSIWQSPSDPAFVFALAGVSRDEGVSWREVKFDDAKRYGGDKLAGWERGTTRLLILESNIGKWSSGPWGSSTWYCSTDDGVSWSRAPVGDFFAMDCLVVGDALVAATWRHGLWTAPVLVSE